jgi:hypothetical protein
MLSTNHNTMWANVRSEVEEECQTPTFAKPVHPPCHPMLGWLIRVKHIFAPDSGLTIVLGLMT